MSLDADVTFPACPPGIPGPQDNCVKVDVFRNQARGNPLPTFFGRLAGVMNQGAVATATAQVVSGDSTACLRPWAVVDRWQEFGPEGPGLLPTSTFDKYSTGQGNNPPPEADLYIPPSQGGGTGYTLPADRGRQFAIKMGPIGRKRDFVRLVQNARSSARRHDAAGKQHGSEQHPDLQRTCRPALPARRRSVPRRSRTAGRTRPTGRPAAVTACRPAQPSVPRATRSKP